MSKNWNMPTSFDEAEGVKVFSGGACNYLDDRGVLQRNPVRDLVNDHLTEEGVFFFDPQIHPETHGVEYDFAIHGPLEVAARQAAKINLYEISPYTLGGITSLEIASDLFRYKEPLVLFFSNGDPKKETLPIHSNKGYPLFVPKNIFRSEDAMRAHFKEFIKNGNNMRRYLMRFASEMDTLTVTFGPQSWKGDVVISPDRIHAADLFAAVVRAASGERVFVNFTGDESQRDSKGNPIMDVPMDLPEVQMRAYLDQYCDEGNTLRRTISELVTVNVYMRVVFTQQSAITALDELIQLDKTRQ